VIYGQRGSITFDPWYLCPDRVILRESGKDPVIAETPHSGSGREYTLEQASADILAGRAESRRIPLWETLTIMEIMDAIRGQIGVTYENDG